MAKIDVISIDCGDAAALAAFWASALDGEVADGASVDFAVVSGPWPGPDLMFDKVPERRIVKNRMHLDLSTPDREAEVARLVALGATVLYEKTEGGHHWVTLQDPEGNEFCVSEPHQER